jgi:hypothetical protein
LARDHSPRGSRRQLLSSDVAIPAVGGQVEQVDFANNRLRVHQQLDRHRQLTDTKGANPRKGKRDRRDTNPIDLLPPAQEALLELRMNSVSTLLPQRRWLWSMFGTQIRETRERREMTTTRNPITIGLSVLAVPPRCRLAVEQIGRDPSHAASLTGCD